MSYERRKKETFENAKSTIEYMFRKLSAFETVFGADSRFARDLHRATLSMQEVIGELQKIDMEENRCE